MILLIAIDPSIRSLGLTAMLIDPTHGHTHQAQVLECGTFATKEHDSWRLRSATMAHRVRSRIEHLIDEHQVPTVVVMETPANWFNQRGQASKDSESVQKLYHFVGELVGQLSRTDISRLWVTTPSGWKGTTPKAIMVKRAITYGSRYGLQLDPSYDDACESLMLARAAVEHRVLTSGQHVGHAEMRGPFELVHSCEFGVGDQGEAVRWIDAHRP